MKILMLTTVAYRDYWGGIRQFVSAIIVCLVGWWFLEWLSPTRTEIIIFEVGGFFWLFQDWHAKGRMLKILAELADVQRRLKDIQAELRLNQAMLDEDE